MYVRFTLENFCHAELGKYGLAAPGHDLNNASSTGFFPSV
jgi:hypothetical protein